MDMERHVIKLRQTCASLNMQESHLQRQVEDDSSDPDHEESPPSNWSQCDEKSRRHHIPPDDFIYSRGVILENKVAVAVAGHR